MSPRRESYSTDRIGSYDGSNFFRLSTMTGSLMLRVRWLNITK